MNELASASETITPATETAPPATDAGTPAGHGTRTRASPAGNRDVEAFLASEDRLLASGTDQGAAASTSGDTNGNHGAALGASTDGTSMSHPGTGAEAHQRTGEDATPGPDASKAVAAIGETGIAIRPESADSPDIPSGGTRASGSGAGSDAAVDALVAQEDLLLGISTRPDDKADDGDEAKGSQGADEAAGDPPTGKDEPGPADTAGKTDPVGKPDDDHAANENQDGQPQDAGQQGSTPEHAEPPEGDAQQEAVEAPGEPDKQQPDPPEAAPDQQPEVPQSVQALIAEQVAGIKAELKAEYDADLANVRSELAHVKEALAAQSKTEVPNTDSAKRADSSTEPDTTEQGDFRDRSQPDAGKNAEGHSNEPDRRPWNSDARLGLYAAVSQAAPSVAAAIAQPDVINTAAALGTFLATVVAGVLVRRSERREQHGH